MDVPYSLANNGDPHEQYVSKDMDHMYKSAKQVDCMDEANRGVVEPYPLLNKTALELGTMEKGIGSSSGNVTMLSGIYCTEVDDSDHNLNARLSPDERQKDHMKTPFSHSKNESRAHLLFKQASHHQTSCSVTSRETSSSVPFWAAQPLPSEGRRRKHSLPRYWPQPTDQELHQVVAIEDSNSAVIPLFEKMLSASDAGQTGRLVLPKACAEAYFPPISQPEGLPVKIQDFSGKDRVFQFRFWPNNNSRMYVLEGIAPCIQSVQLQAGDFVTFSRLDPEGKLVMGYRRAVNMSIVAESSQPTTSNSSATSIVNTNNLAALGDPTGFLSRTAKRATDFQAKGVCKGPKTKGGSFNQSFPIGEKRKARNNTGKSKRVQMDAPGSVEFRITWEEAQDLLQSPPNVTPSIVTVEGYEFEEFEEPPVLYMTSIFDRKGSGNSCKVSEGVGNPVARRTTKDAKKREVAKPLKEAEPLAGLETLANAATVKENIPSSPVSPATTTKHPRHRPGCTCIVCIQPPSGKGPKHNPTCKCTVCVTVRRRFTTLMERRKNRQSEHEAEATTQKKPLLEENVGDANTMDKWKNDKGDFHGSIPRHFPFAWPQDPQLDQDALGVSISTHHMMGCKESFGNEGVVANNAWIDLNVQPVREDASTGVAGEPSMIELLKSASYPLDMYMKEHRLATLIFPPQLLVQPTSDVAEVRGDEHSGNS